MKYKDIKIDHIPLNPKKRPGRKLTSYNWITVHNTGNPSSSAKNPARMVSVNGQG